jgi:hypothetical protein
MLSKISFLCVCVRFVDISARNSLQVECPVDDLVTHEDCYSKIIKEGECKVGSGYPPKTYARLDFFNSIDLHWYMMCRRSQCKAHYAKSTASLWTIFTISLPVYE